MVYLFVNPKCNFMYSVSRLKTIAECEQTLAMATSRKADLEFEKVALTREHNSLEKNTAVTMASLLSTKAEITGTEAAIREMPEGEPKREMVSKLRRLNDRRENLEERIQKGGTASLLDTELDAELISKQLAEVSVFYHKP